jgi:hypothetical protein
LRPIIFRWSEAFVGAIRPPISRGTETRVSSNATVRYLRTGGANEDW